MRSQFKSFYTFIIISIFVFLAACGTSSHTVTPTPIPVVVTMAPPASQTVTSGGTLTLSASVANDSTNAGLTWIVTCSQASCGSLSSSTGTSVTYTAPASLTANLSVTITVASKADATKSAGVTITITPAPVVSITISPATAQTVMAAGTLSFSATVANDSANKGLTWSLSCSKSSCGSLSSTTASSTTYTAPASVPVDLSVTLTAAATADATKTATVVITVKTPPAISVAITPSAQLNVLAGGTLNFAATVANDSGNKGVNWAVSCTQSDCGSLSSLTASATTFTAPATVSANLAVSLTATSVADPTKLAAVDITVTPPSPNTLLKGQYGFVFSGFTDAAGTTPVARDAMLGSFTADGNGNITSGVIYVNSIYGMGMGTITGTYNVGADHRGTMTISVAAPEGSTLRHLMAKRSLRSQTLGSSTVGPFTFAFALGSAASDVATKGTFIETDDTTGDAQRGTGRLLLQTPSAFLKTTINGGYAYLMIGESVTEDRLASAGVFNADGNDTITGGTGDLLSNAGGVMNANNLTGNFGTPDPSTGVLALQLTCSCETATAPTHYYAVIIDSEQILLMSAPGHDAYDIYAGVGHQQKPTTFGDSSLNGNFVASEMDAEVQSAPTGAHRMDAGGTPTSTVFEDVLLHGSFDGAGNMTVDASDENQGGNYSPGSENGTYLLSIGSNGRVIMAGANAPGMAFYLYNTNKGYFVDWGGGNDVGYGQIAAQDPALDSCLGYISGTYVMRGEWSLDATHPDFSGVVNIAADGTLSGSDDYAYQGPVQTIPIPGTATQFSSNGRFLINDTNNSTLLVCYITSARKIDCANPTAGQPTIIHLER